MFHVKQRRGFFGWTPSCSNGPRNTILSPGLRSKTVGSATISIAPRLRRFSQKDARTLVDLGSGAGFPGLILAAFLMEKDVHVTLVESRKKKAAFLTAAGEAMGLSNLEVRPERIESVVLPNPPDIITARALARLEKLLGYGFGIQGQSTKYYLPKGQDVEFELTEAAKSWQMDVIRHPSATSADSTILEIGNLTRV